MGGGVLSTRGHTPHPWDCYGLKKMEAMAEASAPRAKRQKPTITMRPRCSHLSTGAGKRTTYLADHPLLMVSSHLLHWASAGRP